jgi:hypothetical protein
MRIYMFRSDGKRELGAFAGDSEGSRLPNEFGPWRITGVIGPSKAPPFKLSRAVIEQAISDTGFQLWRSRAKAGAS